MKTVLIVFCLFMGASTAHAQSQNDLHTELLATWKKHTEMNSLLLKGVSEAYLVDKSASGGRTVGAQFAHMHNVRLMWVGEMPGATAPRGLDQEIDDTESLKSDYLHTQLSLSDKLMAELLEKGLQEGTKFGDMSAVRFMSYLIAHEAHTRGQIVLVMKQSGHALGPQITYGIWKW